ncbi:MAG TPA: hypothetical protein VGV37_25325 [Aliidongia sp.]|uniref:hypothetical protein n=1 Tax=Aliidongia sp. TaxID=1914230 RepID=UPI002DDCC19D|nr:hypothetical protein [Aliidongia sp.]HEV2677878.1 hypothetical protein [Aliidongia sp.]
MNTSHGAEIIAFPIKTPSCINQQRWIPSPEARRAAAAIPIAGYLRLCGIVFAALLSWVLVISLLRRVATILQG